MQDQKITFIVNGKVYKVDTNDRTSMQKIARVDRLQLIHALESLKNVEATDQSTVAQAKPTIQPKPNPVSKTVSKPATKPIASTNPTHRTGKGDADVLMQQLIMQQKNQNTELPDKNTVYKWFLIFFVVLVIVAWII
ncbi:hypothetical protein [Marinicella sp. W31]|uniref:hypothetical protein n=1 Tax=Marinicella sp. W31 TaxID=3023713 RepID=UPI0037576C70